MSEARRRCHCWMALDKRASAHRRSGMGVWEWHGRGDRGGITCKLCTLCHRVCTPGKCEGEEGGGGGGGEDEDAGESCHIGVTMLR